MKLIFCKSTEKRRREFQIYTCIMQNDDRVRYVIKKPVSERAKAHIERMAINFHMLNTILPGQVVSCKNEKEGIVFPYIEGISFNEILKKELSSNEELAHWNRSLNKWKQLLIGNVNNIVPFDNSLEFQQIFGDGKLLCGEKALRITNFDCIAQNIILSNNKKYIIDYEWVYDFPIPLDFTFYRVLKQFYTDCKGKFPFEKMLEAAEITDEEKIQEYERLLDSFDLYISYDKEEDILYAGLGKIFKQPKIRLQNEKQSVKFLFPQEQIADGSRLILYGAGDVGMSFYQHLKTSNKYHLVKWVDRRYEQYREYGYDVWSCKEIIGENYDYILLAVYNENMAEEIKEELKLLGVDIEKTVWFRPQYAQGG